MSLGGWLTAANPQLNLKKDTCSLKNDDFQVYDKSIRMKLFPSITRTRHPNKHRELANLLPEFRLGRRSVCGWSQTAHLQHSNSWNSMKAVPNSALNACGTNHGTVALLKDAEVVGEIELVKRWNAECISDFYGTSRIMCGTDDGLQIVDMETQASLRYSDFREPCNVLATLGSVTAASMKGESVVLIDARTDSSFLSINKPHAVAKGPKAQRHNPKICSLQWANENLLATSSSSSERVMFWDIRNSKSSLMSVNTIIGAPINRELPIGISSLTANNGSIYAWSHQQQLLKLGSYNSVPDYRINLVDRFKSLHSRLQFISNPVYPAIAINSHTNVVLVSVPSAVGQRSKINGTQAVYLAEHSDRSNNIIEYNSFSGELVCSYGNSVEIFKHNGANGARFLKTRMVGVNNS